MIITKPAPKPKGLTSQKDAPNLVAARKNLQNLQNQKQHKHILTDFGKTLASREFNDFIVIPAISRF
jgi:hypothetical protein